MTNIPPEITRALEPALGGVCKSALISTLGSLQIGFGVPVDHLIGGKFLKKRFEIEIGSYSDAWRCIKTPSSGITHDISPQTTLREVLDRRLHSIEAVQGQVCITLDGGIMLLFGQSENDDDTFYVHVRGGSSIYFNPQVGWSLESST